MYHIFPHRRIIEMIFGKKFGQKCVFFVCILLGISPASDYGLPTFRNTLSLPSSKALKMEQIECSETSANNQTPGKYPKQYRQDSKHGESLKSRMYVFVLPATSYLTFHILRIVQ